MAQKAKKPCAHPGCYELVRDGRFCFKHQNESKKQKRERDQYYDKNSRDKQAKAFYNSREWQAVRRRALMRDHYLCQDCLKERSITRAITVHHLVEVRQDWDKRLQLENLVSLCLKCHNIRHK